MNHEEYLFKGKLKELERVENMLSKRDKIDQAKVVSDLWRISESLNSQGKIIDRIRDRLYFGVGNYAFFSGFNQKHIEDYAHYCGSAYKVYMVLCTPVYDSRVDRDEKMMEEMHSALSKYVDPDIWGKSVGISGINTALNIYGILAGGLRQNFGTS
jgi:hypothetical protein